MNLKKALESLMTFYQKNRDFSKKYPVVYFLALCSCFVLFTIINNFPIPLLSFSLFPVKNFDFINSIVAFGTISSSAALIYFGQLTYKKQNDSEFFSMFPIFLVHHDIILKESFLEDELVDTYKFLVKNFPNFGDFKRDEKMKKCIEFLFEKSNFKRYFVFLYRFIKYIDDSSVQEKKEYTSLVRTKIPFHILFLSSLNIYKGDPIYERYKSLLEKYNFLEHLPVNQTQWIEKIVKNKIDKDDLNSFARCLSSYKETAESDFLAKEIWGNNIH